MLFLRIIPGLRASGNRERGDLRGTFRLSDAHDDGVDGVAVASRRVDAIFMILKFGNGRKSRRVADLGHDENVKTHVLEPQR